jgi:hypothetical protein
LIKIDSVKKKNITSKVGEETLITALEQDMQRKFHNVRVQNISDILAKVFATTFLHFLYSATNQEILL